MRRLALVALAGLVLAAGTGSAATPAPRIRVVEKAPLVVVGSNFEPGEIVTVTVAVPRAAARATLRRKAAVRAGGFRLRFPRILVGDCDTYGIRAVGNKGSRAAYKPPHPMCGTQPQQAD